MSPPPADLLAEHQVHQLRVVVVHPQAGGRAVQLVVDVLQVDLAVPGRDGGDVDHPRGARLRQLLPQQVGQQEVREMVALNISLNFKGEKVDRTWLVISRPSSERWVFPTAQVFAPFPSAIPGKS